MNLRHITAAMAFSLAAITIQQAQAEKVLIDDVEYEMTRIIDRQIGPGTQYLRLQLPDIPVNINLVIADLNNPYVRIENSVANESAKGVEKIENATKRLSTEGHKAIAAQNANFWAVSSQTPDGKLFGNQTRNISIRNGKIVTECNMGDEMAFGGPSQVTGLMGISFDNTAYVDYCTPSIAFRINDATTTTSVAQCNKGVHYYETGMYNSFYGADTPFKPISKTLSNGFYVIDETSNDATEVLLDLNEGETWRSGEFIAFTVKEIREKAGRGTLGNHDLALVGRGARATKLSSLQIGDKVELRYGLRFAPAIDGGTMPVVETAIGGNLLMMRDGKPLSQCNAADYDKMTYARSLYGCSADGKTLYMMVVDKATDPVYGKSAGLSTWRAAQIAAYFGCSNMMQCDGGGSAQLYVTDKIVNKTTETTPRSVANSLMVFDNAPANNTPVRIEIDYPEKQIAVDCGASFVPKILVYNEYGSLLEVVNSGFTMSCSNGLGKVSGITFVASQTPVAGTLTVTYNGITTSRKVSVGGAQSGVDNVTVDAAESVVVVPASATCGQEVSVRCGGMSAVEIFNMGGALVSRTAATSADYCMVEAPAAPGVYVVSALTASGRSTTKLLVN